MIIEERQQLTDIVSDMNGSIAFLEAKLKTLRCDKKAELGILKKPEHKREVDD